MLFRVVFEFCFLFLRFKVFDLLAALGFFFTCSNFLHAQILLYFVNICLVFLITGFF